MTKLSWRVAAITDRGLKRPDNQDNYFVSADSKLFVIADGMGGAAEELGKLFLTTQPEMGEEGRVPPPLDGVYASWMTVVCRLAAS